MYQVYKNNLHNETLLFAHGPLPKYAMLLAWTLSSMPPQLILWQVWYKAEARRIETYEKRLIVFYVKTI